MSWETFSFSDERSYSKVEPRLDYKNFFNQKKKKKTRCDGLYTSKSGYMFVSLGV